jgi:hypothetical protein
MAQKKKKKGKKRAEAERKGGRGWETTEDGTT